MAKADPKKMYIKLLKFHLTNFLYAEQIYDKKTFTLKMREEGRDWPAVAHTMIGLKRINNLQFCVEDVIKRKVPGHFIETGVWRGGACIFIKGILKANRLTSRQVWVADSFEGIPKPDGKYIEDLQYAGYKHKELAVPLSEVKENFKKYNLLDKNVKFLKGFFKDTLCTIPNIKFAVVRLDGDAYESTIQSLEHLYPKLSIGGFLIVDDYKLKNCRKAVKNFRKTWGIKEKIRKIDWCGVYWKKTRNCLDKKDSHYF